VKVLRLAPLCLMWCIWRAQNARSFGDQEILVVELKYVMFKSLHTWIVAYNTLQFSSFCYFFFGILFFLCLIRGFSCIFLVYYHCAPLHFLMRLNDLSKTNIYGTTSKQKAVSMIIVSSSWTRIHKSTMHALENLW
jgi:hypothetical protein